MGALTQFQPVSGVIDLAWGHPDPTLLPVQQLRAAAERAMDRYGPEMLAYGNPAGPPPLITFICDRLSQTDGRAPSPAEVVITSGASQGLDLAAAFLLDPGDTVLIDVPTYHLAIRILRDHPVQVVGVPSDADGIVLYELARVVKELRQRQRRPRLLYTIPTFHNPTGRVMPRVRRAELLAFAAREELLIVEDDTYRELSYDGPSPASLWALDASSSVIRLGSFAKSVAPGLRVGYITADAGLVARMVAGGLLDSGGGATHYAATVLAEYAAGGDYARQVDRFRDAYRAQRDRLMRTLSEHMSETVSWSVPAGGYFVWVQLPNGMSAERLLAVASANGMEFLPANVFFLDRDQSPDALRLAFSMHPPDVLAEAGARLASAITKTMQNE
ncbi:MAG: PLP-dependent aminotransferase family protein [Candidatus Limnocylindria bacterium]